MDKKNIKILDCTLRDGGYLIDWIFGRKNIQSIISNLEKSNIDFIECGFLKSCDFDFNKTFFNNVKTFSELTNNEINYTLMVNYGEYDISNFYDYIFPNIKIRVAFKKNNQQEALSYINTLKSFGLDVFANPMNTNTYSNQELLYLIKEFNLIKPYGVTIVDTFGNMYENDVENLFSIFDKNLDKNIALGFHSHNSMQLSFSNTKTLLKMNIKRDLIIDSCLYGMGRGAGNLCTELITKYLNDNYNAKYLIEPILKTINENITPFFEEKKWGYSLPYYIAAINNCHPNYAGFLVEKGFSDEEISKTIPLIVEKEKNIFNKEYILNLSKTI